MNGNIPPHLPQSKNQPKSGRMAGVQRCGRSPATVSHMIINELNSRCRNARSFCKFLKYERKKAENDTPLNTIQTRQDVFKIRLDKIKKRQEKFYFSFDVFTLLVSSVCEACFIDQRDLLHRLMILASLTYAASLIKEVQNPLSATQQINTQRHILRHSIEKVLLQTLNPFGYISQHFLRQGFLYPTIFRHRSQHAMLKQVIQPRIFLYPRFLAFRQ